MIYHCLFAVCLGYFGTVCLGEQVALRGPPKVDTNPKFSNSYIPAAMQIIAHDTELMKYVIKPPTITTTTTTTMRPTPPHIPGIVAPSNPQLLSKSNRHDLYLQIQQQPTGNNYFARYYPLLTNREGSGRALQGNEDGVYEDIDNYLGKDFGEALRLANKIDQEDLSLEDYKVLVFSRDFEDRDSPYKFEILRQKRVPPTKAYVTLLSLYDLLNKESKKLMLNKYSGYNKEVLDNLIEYSKYTSSKQLREVLNKIIENGNTRQSDLITKIKAMISDLDTEKSYINEALNDIPALVFAS